LFICLTYRYGIICNTILPKEEFAPIKQTSLTSPSFINTLVPSQVNEPSCSQSCIYVLELSMLPLFLRFFYSFFGTVPTVWYCGTVPTVWYCFFYFIEHIVIFIKKNLNKFPDYVLYYLIGQHWNIFNQITSLYVLW
jgi:hypothetical protein